jgi:hypothetical protein
MPTYLPTHCNGCYKPFNLPAICRHNEIKDKLVALTTKAFTPSAVHDKPQIHPSDAAQANVREAHPNPVIQLTRHSQEADRGDILIHGLWQQGTDCILDVRVMDVNAKSNRSKPPDMVLE